MVTEERTHSGLHDNLHELGRRARRRHETLNRLFVAAMELFARKGFATTKVEDITEAADVGKGTFFNYFPSKEHVLAHFAGKQAAKVEHCLGLAKQGDVGTHEVLSSLARDLARVPGKSPEMARALVLSLLGNAEVRDFILHEMENGRAMIAEIMKLGQERGELRRDLDPIDMACAFQQSLFGTVLLWSLKAKSPLSRLLDNTISVLYQGLQAPSVHRAAGTTHSPDRERKSK